MRREWKRSDASCRFLREWIAFAALAISKNAVARVTRHTVHVKLGTTSTIRNFNFFGTTDHNRGPQKCMKVKPLQYDSVHTSNFAHTELAIPYRPCLIPPNLEMEF